MKRLGARIVWSLIGMVALAAALLHHEGASSMNRWGANHFGNVELVTQDGRRVRLYDDLLKGKAVAVNTFFAGCTDVCPLGTAKLLELQKLLGARVGKDVLFYSISVDPVHDTPQALSAYAERFGIGKGWLLLTGRERDVRVAMRKLGLGTLGPASPRDAHSTTLMVGHEPSGRWMKHSATDNPRFLAASIQTFLGWGERPPGSRDYAAARAMPEITNGQFLFANGCSSCHTVGGGDRIGPDLAGVTERRQRAWLERFILVPDEVIRSGDPIARALLERHRGVQMPNLGLARDEVDDILAHIDARTAALRTRVSTSAVGAGRP